MEINQPGLTLLLGALFEQSERLHAVIEHFSKALFPFAAASGTLSVRTKLQCARQICAAGGRCANRDGVDVGAGCNVVCMRERAGALSEGKCNTSWSDCKAAAVAVWEMQADAVPKSAPESDGLLGFDETRVERQTNRRAGMEQAASGEVAGRALCLVSKECRRPVGTLLPEEIAAAAVLAFACFEISCE